MARPAEITQVYERNQEATLYVGNLDAQTDDDIIWEIFVQCGVIRSVHMPRDKITGQHQNYCFVEFESEIDADYAMKIMNMVKVNGKPMRVNKAAQDKRTLEVGANLFVGNLDPDVDEKTLYDCFSSFGTILSTKVMRDPDTGASKGFAFISFDGFESSDAALTTMNGQFLCNRPVHVSYAYKKDTRGERHGSAAERLIAASRPVDRLGGSKVMTNGSISGVPPNVPPAPLSQPRLYPMGVGGVVPRPGLIPGIGEMPPPPPPMHGHQHFVTTMGGVGGLGGASGLSGPSGLSGASGLGGGGMLPSPTSPGQQPPHPQQSRPMGVGGAGSPSLSRQPSVGGLGGSMNGTVSGALDGNLTGSGASSSGSGSSNSGVSVGVSHQNAYLSSPPSPSSPSSPSSLSSISQASSPTPLMSAGAGGMPHASSMGVAAQLGSTTQINMMAPPTGMYGGVGVGGGFQNPYQMRPAAGAGGMMVPNMSSPPLAGRRPVMPPTVPGSLPPPPVFFPPRPGMPMPSSNISPTMALTPNQSTGGAPGIHASNMSPPPHGRQMPPLGALGASIALTGATGGVPQPHSPVTPQMAQSSMQLGASPQK